MKRALLFAAFLLLGGTVANADQFSDLLNQVLAGKLPMKDGHQRDSTYGCPSASVYLRVEHALSRALSAADADALWQRAHDVYGCRTFDLTDPVELETATPDGLMRFRPTASLQSYWARVVPAGR